MNISASIYLPQSYFSKKTETNSETSLCVTIHLMATRAAFLKSPKSVHGYAGDVSQYPGEVRRIWTHLSPKSRKTMSRSGINENIRALLGYISKKRRTGNNAESPVRRRRSVPKQSKRSANRSRKSRRTNTKSE